ncbi:MAG: hypothetical protein OEU92_02500 [Alphaproteobacteria bacterium]|nr:hypothetical protein [Alphaproteobacteria bacterium]
MGGFDLLEPWVYWRFDLDFILNRLAIGLDLFGPYGSWLWAVPAYLAIAAILVRGSVAREQRRSDCAYLAYVSRRLPTLGHLARVRAREVSDIRRREDQI